MPSGEAAVELAAADGVRLAARFWPAEDRRLAYVVAHGFTGSSRRPALAAICYRLAGRAGAVLALDLRGHGKSGGSSWEPRRT